MAPPWLQLVRRRQRVGGLALTLPFLVGALRNPPGAPFADKAASYGGLLSLLEQMRDQAPESHYVHVYECDRLRQPVVSITPTFYSPSAVDWGIATPSGRECRLYIAPKYQSADSGAIGAVAGKLWEMLSSALVEGRFSFRSGSYQPFNGEDKRFVADALLHDQDNEF